MDIIPDRKPVSPLLLVALAHLLFVLGAWQSVLGVTDSLVYLKSLTNPAEFTLPRDFALRLWYLFVGPVIAATYVCLVNQKKWFEGRLHYSYPVPALLILLLIVSSLLAFAGNDRSLFGWGFATAFGLFSTMYLKPIWALALQLSLGITITILVFSVFGSFFGVLFGLAFQNLLLIGFLVGLILQKVLARQT